MYKVAVIGAGYGGLRALENLVDNNSISLYLFDQNSYHYLQTEVYGYIAGRFDMHDVALDINNWCHGFERPITFVKEKIEYICSKDQSIQTKTSTFKYDYLIIATGARTNFFSFINGMDKYGYGVKKLFRSHSFRTSFEQQLYEKLQNPYTQGKTINLAIGGAGLSGVEIAAEMSDVVKRHAKSIGESAKEIHIYLIDASDSILPGMSEYIIKHTQDRLNKLGVKIMTNSFIESLDANSIYFKDATKLDYTSFIFTGGILANTIDSDFESKLNKTNQYICDDTQRIYKNIFTVGDCCEIKDKDAKTLPPTAQIAEKSAEYAADAIKKLILNKKIEPFSGSVDGVFVALGGKYAVGELFSLIKVKGYMAYLLKKTITKSYYIGLKLRLNTGFKKRTLTKKMDLI
jgi:NADH dehydrogenase